MTKLMEWLCAIAVFLAIWLSLLTNKLENSFIEHHHTFILFSPVILIGLFGVYSIVVILYRVFTFNNCEEAAAELQKEILEAREDLTSRGFKFRSELNT